MWNTRSNDSRNAQMRPWRYWRGDRRRAVNAVIAGLVVLVISAELAVLGYTYLVPLAGQSPQSSRQDLNASLSILAKIRNVCDALPASPVATASASGSPSGSPSGAPGGARMINPWGSANAAPLPYPAPANPFDRLGANLHSTSLAAIDEAATTHWKWVRIDMLWDYVERSPGVYNFSEWDRFISQLQARGMNALLILDYGNPLYDGGGPPRSPEAIKAFGNFARAAAAHFAGRGIRWEIWNEPEQPVSWSTGPSASEYAALEKVAAAQIHAGDPNALVIAEVTGHASYVRAFFEAGGGRTADAFAVHPYRRYNGGETLLTDLAETRALVSHYVSPNTPIWNTEWGYSSTWYGSGDALGARLIQAKFTARELLNTFAAGLPFSIYYDLNDGAAAPNDSEKNFGLYDVYGNAKPAMAAVTTLDTAVFSGRVFDGVLPTPVKSLHALRFVGQNDMVLAVWASDPATAGAPATGAPVASVPFRNSSRCAAPTAVDYLGRPVSVRPISGGYSVVVGDAPVYVRFALPPAS